VQCRSKWQRKIAEGRGGEPSGMSQNAGHMPRAARVGRETLASNKPKRTRHERQAGVEEGAAPCSWANLREESTQPDVKLKILSEPSWDVPRVGFHWVRRCSMPSERKEEDDM